MKILLVDDSEQTTNSLALLIGRRDVGAIRVAYKGDEAVRIAAEFKPDVVVLDIDLPVLNGFEVLEEFKKREIDTRVIMVSGVYTDTEHIVRCIRAGACDFIKKPTNADIIVSSIQRHFLLENADNLCIYSQAPNLIKQLVDRAEDAEKNHSIEIKELNLRASTAEGELEKLAAEKQVSQKQGKWQTWWNKISPNERAAYIGLFGICMAGTFTFAVAAYNKLPVDREIKAGVSELSRFTPKTVLPNATSTPTATVSLSPTSITPPPTSTSIPVPSTPFATPHSKILGLTFEQYYDKLNSFGGRLGLRADYLNSVDGAYVAWQGIVVAANFGSSDNGYVSIRSELDTHKYDAITTSFTHLNQETRDRIHSLEIGDLVQISGSLITKREAAMDAESIVIIRPVGKLIIPSQP